jgi:DNA polymerase III subunit delta
MAARAKATKPGDAALGASMRIVAVHGKDRYRIAAVTRELIEALREAHGEIEQFSFDGESAQLADVLDELRSFGLMQRHKLVILDNADAFLKADGRREPMERYAERPVADATLLLRAEAWHPGKLDKLITRVGTVIKADLFKPAEAAAWCMNEAAPRYGSKLEAPAAEQLVELIGPDRGRLEMELAKLAAYVECGKPISRAIVSEMVGMTREEAAWAIQGPLAAGDAAGAITQMRAMMAVSRQPDTVLTLVSWSMCDLLRKVHGVGRLLRQGANAFEAGRQFKVWGDSRDAILRAARRLDPAKLAVMLDLAVGTDFHNKTGLGHPARSLEALAVRIADVMRSE